MPIKIDPVSLRPTQVPRRGSAAAAASGSGEFAKVLGGTQNTGAHSVGMSVGVSSLAMVLAVQEAPEATTGRARQRARERGQRMLDYLDEIRLGLLTGAMPRERLEQLAHMVRSKRDQIDDPKLIAILDEIELRAAVELAKLSR